MSMSTRPSDPRLLRILAALEAVPPAPLSSYPWMHPVPARTPRWRRLLRPRVGLAMTAGAVACAGAVVVSGIASTNPTPSLSPATRKAFAVFNGSGVRPSPAAMKVIKQLMPPRIPYNVIDQRSFRVAQSNATFEIIVFGNSTDVCLVEREPRLAAGGGCAPETSAASAMTLGCGTIEAPGGIEAPGTKGVLLDCLVPNDVSNITASTPAGTVPLSIVNNTVGAVLDPKPTSVSWTTPDGTRREEQLIQ
jgi:hypothetical protein